jgi:hypothetical protein
MTCLTISRISVISESVNSKAFRKISGIQKDDSIIICCFICSDDKPKSSKPYFLYAPPKFANLSHLAIQSVAPDSVRQNGDAPKNGGVWQYKEISGVDKQVIPMLPRSNQIGVCAQNDWYKAP